MAIVTIPNTEKSYYLEGRLKKNLDERIIPDLIKKDRDYVLVIDSNEGSGKSTLAFQIGRYVDPTLNISRICFSASSFKSAIVGATKGQCVIFDEAFTGLSSRAALTTISRMLVSLMMQMRQKNLFVIIVLPTIYLLDKYVAQFRANSLIHVYENKKRRGYFRVYNRKKIKQLYHKCAKSYSYWIKTGFKGRFYGKFALGDKEDGEAEKEYRMKKAEALESMEDDYKEKESRKAGERKIFLTNLFYCVQKIKKMPQTKFVEWLKSVNVDMTSANLSKIMKETREKGLILDFNL